MVKNDRNGNNEKAANNGNDRKHRNNGNNENNGINRKQGNNEKYGNHGKDGNHGYHFASVTDLINGYGEWIQRLFDDGFRMYLVTFTFNQIQGSSEYKWREMLKQVEYQFYPTLIKHVERWPMKPSRQSNLPRLIAVPDLPVAKNPKKLPLKDVTRRIILAFCG